MKAPYSQYKTFDNGISMQKPFIDPVDLKPKFQEKLFFAGRSGTIREAREFANDLLHACQKAEELKYRFERNKNNESELLKIVEEFKHQF